MSLLDKGLSTATRGLRATARATARAVAGAGSRIAGDRRSGDWDGGHGIRYAPVDVDRADPGEVVWAWVPFEEDDRKGKDRPVLVIGRDRDRFLALQLTSKDHDLDAAQEAAEGRYWIDIGTGAWDRHRRPSEARVNRLLRLEPDAVRRTGARLDKEIFDTVVAQVRTHYPNL